MKHLLPILLLGGAMQAQSFTASVYAIPDEPSPRPFWTVENKVDFGILAGLVAADGIMRPLVTRGAGGEAVGSALGFGAGVGVAYWLHRGHHYKAERITMRLMVAGEAGFVANNIVAIH
ncbi:MAG: hypothetical protein ABSD76_11905 [Terriglobales bacterium]